MSHTRRIAVVFVLLVAAFLAGCRPSAAARTFEHEAFTFTIPAGWQTLEEVWKRPISPQKDYYGLGLQEIVTIQYPPKQGQGSVFFAVATAPLAEGQDLQARLQQTYAETVPAGVDASVRAVECAGLSGYEITYKRPWGEPWWQFRDIWLAKDGVIYVLSFHTSPHVFASYSEVMDQIIGSFRFKDAD